MNAASRATSSASASSGNRVPHPHRFACFPSLPCPPARTPAPSPAHLIPPQSRHLPSISLALAEPHPAPCDPSEGGAPGRAHWLSRSRQTRSLAACSSGRPLPPRGVHMMWRVAITIGRETLPEKKTIHFGCAVGARAYCVPRAVVPSPSNLLRLPPVRAPGATAGVRAGNGRRVQCTFVRVDIIVHPLRPACAGP